MKPPKPTISPKKANKPDVIIEVTTDGFVAVDRRFRITYLNAASELSSGTTRERAIGRTIWKVFPALDGTPLKRDLERNMADHTSVEVEHFHKQSKRWFIVRAHPDESSGLWIFFHDITAAKEQEFETRAVHQRAFEILESISDGFFAVDDRWRFTYINGRAEMHIQKRSKDLLGKVLWEAFPGAKGRKLAPELRDAVKQRRRLQFVADSPFGRSLEFDVHPCAGGACVYFRPSSAGQAKSHSMADQIIWAEEQERQRVARELHDSVGQLLVALTVGLRNLAEVDGGHEVRVRARRLRAIASRVTREIARLTHQLHGSELRDVGLLAGLRQLTSEVAESYGMPVSFNADDLHSTALDLASQVALYRVVQEALTNVGKHARATRAAVSVQRQRSAVVVEIRDNGKGFKSTPRMEISAGHLGLRSMRERVELLGGSLRVRSVVGRGTSVRVEIPVGAVPNTGRERLFKRLRTAA